MKATRELQRLTVNTSTHPTNKKVIEDHSKHFLMLVLAELLLVQDFSVQWKVPVTQVLMSHTQTKDSQVTSEHPLRLSPTREVNQLEKLRNKKLDMIPMSTETESWEFMLPNTWMKWKKKIMRNSRDTSQDGHRLSRRLEFPNVKTSTRRYMTKSERTQLEQRKQATKSQQEKLLLKVTIWFNKTQRIENGSDTSESTSRKETPESLKSSLLLKRLLQTTETCLTPLCRYSSVMAIWWSWDWLVKLDK